MARDDLRGFWKPDKKTKELLSRKRGKRYNPKRKKKRKSRIKGKSRHAKLCRMSSGFFYWTKEWRALRQKVLDTYGYRCMLCRSVDEIQVDHIKPRSKAPHLSMTFENLQVLCKDCNFEKSNLHAEDYREDAVAEEIDRQIALEAMRLGL